MSDLNEMTNLGVLISAEETEIILPEKALLSSFQAAQEGYPALILIHTWVQMNVDLIHAEALISTLKKTESPGVMKLIAGSLDATGDTRFTKLFEMAKTSDEQPKLNKYISFAAEIGQCLPDASYSKFGLVVSKIDPAPSRKFRPRTVMIEKNPFFFCRKLFGVNWRADIAACFLLDRAKNPTEVSKFLGCSYDSAYRNYHDLLEIGWDKNARKYFAAGKSSTENQP